MSRLESRDIHFSGESISARLIAGTFKSPIDV